MKIVLAALNSKYIHLNLAVRYLREFCRNFDNIEIKELTINDNLNSIISEIFLSKPDVVVFSCYIWNINNILKVAQTIKKADSSIKIGLGGPEVSYNPSEILKENTFVDFIIFGEGEEVFKNYVSTTYSGKNDLSAILGLAYRMDSKIIVNNPQPLINDLDIINFPYESELESIQGRMVYYEASRGCPFNCQYCLSSTTEGVRYFSLERVKSDLKKLINAKVSQVKFVDRTFNCSKKRTLDILSFILNENPDINFHFEITAELLDEEILSLLKIAPEGLFQFEIGVQSTNSETLDIISRKSNFNKLANIVKSINENKNIHLHLDLIAGLPKESYQQFKISFNDVYSLQPQMLQLGFLKALKGSGLRKMSNEYGIEYNEYSPYEVVKTHDISFFKILKLKDIEEIIEKYYNSSRFTKSLKNIIDIYYKDAFEFYEDFSDYWRKSSLFDVQHSLKSLYTILIKFIEIKFGQNNLFNELIKFDYLFNEHNYILPEGIKRKEIDNLQQKIFDFLKNTQNIEKYLPKYSSIPPKQIIKNIHIEVFEYNVLQENILENEDRQITWILFNYDINNKTFRRSNVYDISKEFIVK